MYQRDRQKLSLTSGWPYIECLFLTLHKPGQIRTPSCSLNQVEAYIQWPYSGLAVFWKIRPRASKGQQYPLPCCTHFRFPKCVQQGGGYCWPLLALGRLLDASSHLYKRTCTRWSVTLLRKSKLKEFMKANFMHHTFNSSFSLLYRK